jgi:hypothetical protein
MRPNAQLLRAFHVSLVLLGLMDIRLSLIVLTPEHCYHFRTQFSMV